VKEKFNIVNNPTALLKVFELAGERLAEILIKTNSGGTILGTYLISLPLRSWFLPFKSTFEGRNHRKQDTILFSTVLFSFSACVIKNGK
jgi:hypothetical protein